MGTGNREQLTINKLAVRFTSGHRSHIAVHCSLFTVICYLFIGCATWGAASAEEYYSIGMAYYELGKFAEAEIWLNRAKSKDKTKIASEYQLGRIAFDAGRFEDAAKLFESILKRDPENVMALKAAAYTRIKNGEIEKAEVLYERLLELVPESADDGYNYSLVLFAMKKFAEAEQVLMNHEFALLDNNDVLLLLARTQKEQDKPEAIDTYAKWLINNTDNKVRYEYAGLLESHEYYARAIEECRIVLDALSATSTDPSKGEVHFSVARLLLIADSESNEGVMELQNSINDGFDDFDTIEKLLEDDRISAENKDGIRTAITEAKREIEAAKEAAEKEEAAKAAGTDTVSDEAIGENTDVSNTE